MLSSSFGFLLANQIFFFRVIEGHEDRGKEGRGKEGRGHVFFFYQCILPALGLTTQQRPLSTGLLDLSTTLGAWELHIEVDNI